MGETQPGHDAGDANRPVADLVLFVLHRWPSVLTLRPLLGQQCVHIGPCGQRSPQTEVDDNLLAVVMNDHGAHAARATHPGLHHADRPRGSHGGVDGVAAAP